MSNCGQWRLPIRGLGAIQVIRSASRLRPSNDDVQEAVHEQSLGIGQPTCAQFPTREKILMNQGHTLSLLVIGDELTSGASRQ
jgi:hypothetical protein